MRAGTRASKKKGKEKKRVFCGAAKSIRSGGGGEYLPRQNAGDERVWEGVSRWKRGGWAKDI